MKEMAYECVRVNSSHAQKKRLANVILLVPRSRAGSVPVAHIMTAVTMEFLRDMVA